MQPTSQLEFSVLSFIDHLKKKDTLTVTSDSEKTFPHPSDPDEINMHLW